MSTNSSPVLSPRQFLITAADENARRAPLHNDRRLPDPKGALVAVPLPRLTLARPVSALVLFVRSDPSFQRLPSSQSRQCRPLAPVAPVAPVAQAGPVAPAPPSRPRPYPCASRRPLPHRLGPISPGRSDQVRFRRSHDTHHHASRADELHSPPATPVSPEGSLLPACPRLQLPPPAPFSTGSATLPRSRRLPPWRRRLRSLP